jgi:hypothetical protein
MAMSCLSSVKDRGARAPAKKSTESSAEYCHLLNTWSPADLARILSAASIGPKRATAILAARPFGAATIRELVLELADKCAPIGPETARKIVDALRHQATKREARATKRASWRARGAGDAGNASSGRARAEVHGV